MVRVLDVEPADEVTVAQLKDPVHVDARIDGVPCGTLQVFFVSASTPTTSIAASKVPTPAHSPPTSPSLGATPGGSRMASPRSSSRKSLAKIAVAEAKSRASAADMSVPTLESLGPDTTIPGWTAAAEEDLFTAEELAVAARIKMWMGPEQFAKVPYDQLTTFIRGYAYRTDWPRASYVFLQRMLEWRKSFGCDLVHAKDGARGFDEFSGPRRAEFDDAVQSTIIGHDMHGHLVELNRLFHMPCSKFMNSFTDDEFVKHMVARREVLRALLSANASDRQRKVYKIISIADVSGLSLAHLRDTKFHARMKSFNALFGWHYPETTFKLVVINAPRIFTALWSIAKHFLHPVTVAKVSVLGHNYAKNFRDLGIVLDDGLEMVHGKLPAELPSWRDKLEQLKSKGYADELLTGGWLPAEDVVNVGAA